MSIIIRPSLDVFGQMAPLVLVFGTYRGANGPPIEVCDQTTITEAVQFARRIRAPLAFLREIRSDAPGGWLEGCQPKISDRVFDHPPGSAFCNKEFLSFFKKITSRGVVAVGPRNDSSLRLTLKAAERSECPIRAIVPNHPLQKCSAGAVNAPVILRSKTPCGSAWDLPLSHWRHSLLD